MNYIMNEYEYIKDFMETHELSEGDCSGIKRLIMLEIKYYKKNKEKDIKEKVLNNIIESRRVKLQPYVLSKIYDTVYSCIKYGKPLKEFDYIPLFQSELDRINKLSNDKQKKFMFTCYILSYFYQSEWINLPYNELFKLANIGCTGKRKLIFIKELVDLGCIEISKANTNLSLKVARSFKGKEVMQIKEIDKLGNQLIVFLNDNKIICQRCGKVVKIKSKNDGSSKYCDKCAKEMELEKTKLRVRKFRKV